MQFNALIDQIVRQTTTLIAQLATSAGTRAPLAHLVNQVFLDLTAELEAQGLGRKVVADMFGLALRSYQLKVSRLRQSETDRDQTLWAAILGFIQDDGPVTRARVLERFSYDDDALARAVLRDLVESALVYRTGRGDFMTFRAADPEDLSVTFADDTAARAENLVWIAVYREGPIKTAALATLTRMAPKALNLALAQLVADGRVEELEDAPATWRSQNCFLPAGTTVGWEAAVYDHFQAMVKALCIKLSGEPPRSLPKDVVGGSTWSFDVWRGHPKESEVLGLLSEMRVRVTTLRREVSAYNEGAGLPNEGKQARITFYLGQAAVHGDDYDEGDLE